MTKQKNYLIKSVHRHEYKSPRPNFNIHQFLKPLIWLLIQAFAKNEFKRT
jgi:hypothetical protein